MPDRVYLIPNSSGGAAYAVGEPQGDLGVLTDFGGRLRVREVSVNDSTHYEVHASIGASRLSWWDLVALRDAIDLLINGETDAG